MVQLPMMNHLNLMLCFIQLLDQLTGMFQQLFQFNKTIMVITKLSILHTSSSKKNVTCVLNIHRITLLLFITFQLNMMEKKLHQNGQPIMLMMFATIEPMLLTQLPFKLNGIVLCKKLKKLALPITDLAKIQLKDG